MNQVLLKSVALAEGEVLGKFKDEVFQYFDRGKGYFGSGTAF